MKASIKIKLLSIFKPKPPLQEKTITPTEEVQEITPDANYDGLGKVTINSIPDKYLSNEIIEEWDKTIVEMISFTIGSVQYQAEPGMTWGEWVNSDYGNEYEFHPTEPYIKLKGVNYVYVIMDADYPVETDWKIEDGVGYGCSRWGG